MMNNKKPKVVIITGYNNVGKDTFTGFCSEYASIDVISSISIIKRAARILGWSEGKKPQDDKFLSELKALSVWYNNYPFEDLKRMHREISNYRDHIEIIFMHIREPEEIAKAKKEFDAIVLEIDLMDRPKSDYADIFVVNDGSLDDLKSKARSFVKEILDDDI